MEKKIFQEALSNMSYDFAAKGAIRHLCDLGMDAEEIHKRLSYPLSLDRIQRELEEYAAEQKAAGEGATVYEYIKETDAYGRSSLRRVPVKKDI